MTFNLTITDVLAIFSIVLASGALSVSILGYIRDRGELTVSLWLGHLIQGPMQRKIVNVSVVNSGRRPITLKSVGTEWGGNRFTRFMVRNLVPSYFRPKEAVVFGVELQPLLYREAAKPKILHEGEDSSAVLDFSSADIRDICKHITDTAGSFFILDSVGRRHYLDSRSMAKFRQSFREWSDSDS